MANSVTITGNVKNINARGVEGKVITANLSQRGDDGKCITTMPLVFLGEHKELAKALVVDESGMTKTVQVVGRLVTRFDRRPGIANDQRSKPFTQIEVHSIA